MTRIIIANIFSTLGQIIDNLTGFLTNRKDKTLLANLASTTTSIIALFILGAYDGVVQSSITFVRNLTIYIKDKRGKQWPYMFVVFCIIYTSGLFMWQGPRTLFVYGSNMISFTAKWYFKKMEPIRIAALLANLSSIVYNIIVKNYAGVPFNVFNVCSISLSILRWRLSKER